MYIFVIQLVINKVQSSYVPFIGKSRLREVFLKVDNDMGGEYFGHLIKVRTYGITS